VERFSYLLVEEKKWLPVEANSSGVPTVREPARQRLRAPGTELGEKTKIFGSKGLVPCQRSSDEKVRATKPPTRAMFIQGKKKSATKANSLTPTFPMCIRVGERGPRNFRSDLRSTGVDEEAVKPEKRGEERRRQEFWNPKGGGKGGSPCLQGNPTQQNGLRRAEGSIRAKS